MGKYLTYIPVTREYKTLLKGYFLIKLYCFINGTYENIKNGNNII